MEQTEPTYPIKVVAGNSVNDFDPKLKQSYVQSWNLSFQRELDRSTVVDVRYVGNHAVGLWRQVNINEINIFENGFLDEFKVLLGKNREPGPKRHAGGNHWANFIEAVKTRNRSSVIIT